MRDFNEDTRIRTFECIGCECKSRQLAENILHRVHLDVADGRTSLPCGQPMQRNQVGPMNFLTITDDFTNYRGFYLLDEKSDVL